MDGNANLLGYFISFIQVCATPSRTLCADVAVAAPSIIRRALAVPAATPLLESGSVSWKFKYWKICCGII